MNTNRIQDPSLDFLCFLIDCILEIIRKALSWMRSLNHVSLILKWNLLCHLRVNNLLKFTELENNSYLTSGLFFFLSLFIYFERESTWASRWGAEREGERESQAADSSLDPTNHEIITWAYIKSHMPNWLSHLGAPHSSVLLY